MDTLTNDELIKKAGQAVCNISCYNTRSIGWRAEEIEQMRNELASIEEEIAKRGLEYTREEGLI